MNIHSIKNKLKTSQNPKIKQLFLLLKSIRCGDIKGLSIVFIIITPIYKFITGFITTLLRVFFWTPMFKSQVNSYGSQLYLYGGVPFMTGPLKLSYGDNCRISGQSTFSARSSATTQPELNIGDNVDVGWMTTIAVGQKVNIGNNVRMASQAFIAGYPGHPINALDRAKGLPELDQQVGDINIEDDVWLATGVTILANVRIGKRSIIASGSVVTKDIPEDVIAAGVPAKVVKSIKNINQTTLDKEKEKYS